jgi:hypothetical protein
MLSRVQETDVNSRIDAANAELARAQQQSSLKGQDLRQLEGRRENLHQQVRYYMALYQF